MIELLHAADFHLDSPFEALPPEKAAARREEQRALIERVADLAAARGARLVLLAGDLFDSDKSFLDTSEQLVRTLGRIGAPVFIAPGNHDYYCRRSPYASFRWPDNVHIFKSPAIERVDLPELGCSVYGAGFDDARCSRSLLEGFAAADDGSINIMVLHADLGGPRRIYNPIAEREIAASGLDYLALGHVHAYSGIKRAGGAFYAYPGCPEGRGFDELGDKGVICGRVGKGRAELEFVPTAARRYGIIEVDVGGDRSPGEALLSAIPAGAERDIYRIILRGEVDESGIDIDALARIAGERFYSVSVRDATRMRRDIWEQAGQDTLKGLFLRNMREKYDKAVPEEQERIERAVRYALAALENREVRP